MKQYYKDAIQRAKRRKSPWNLVLLPFALIGMGGAYFLIWKGLLGLQSHLIPKDVFFSSGTRLGQVLVLVPPFFIAIPVGFLFANLIAWSITPARKALDKEADGIKGASFKDAMKTLVALSSATLLIIAPLSLLGVFNYIYVTDKGVFKRPLFSVHEKYYKWSDIQKIHAECSIEDDNFFFDYILYMKNGDAVNLFEESRLGFVTAYDKFKTHVNAQKHIQYEYKISDIEISRLRRSFPQDAEKIIRIIRNE